MAARSANKVLRWFGKTTSRWEFSKDFLEEAALFKLKLAVRVKLGWGLGETEQ